MSSYKARFTQIAVLVTVISFLMAYFVKPHPTLKEIVTADSAVAPSDTKATVPLSTRVAHSYTLAMILVRSDYTPADANALESLRNWANQKFEKDSNFLHPASVEGALDNSQSILDSFTFSTLASVRYLFEDAIAGFLQARIEDFQTSDSYKAFCDDYHDLLGQDFDANQLLARYQTERAKEAIDPILVTLFWLVVSLSLCITLWRRKDWQANERMQHMLAFTWLALAGYYLVSAWIQNQITVLVAAAFCAAVGLYVRRPLKINHDENRGLSFRLVTLSAPVLALLGWLTVSLLLIRVVAWIKTGSLLHSDPVTLVISGLRGDFLHDPVHVKRNIDRAIGLIWLAFTLWTLPRLGGEWTAEAAQEEPLRAIQEPLY